MCHGSFRFLSSKLVEEAGIGPGPEWRQHQVVHVERVGDASQRKNRAIDIRGGQIGSEARREVCAKRVRQSRHRQGFNPIQSNPCSKKTRELRGLI
jgi:hypothetical protein